MKSFIQRMHTLMFAASLTSLVVTVTAMAQEAVSWNGREDYSGQSIDPYENLRRWQASQGQTGGGYGVPGPAMPPWPSQYAGQDIANGHMYQDLPGHIMTNYVHHLTGRTYRTIDTYKTPDGAIFQIYRNDSNQNGYPTNIALYVNGFPSETVESTRQNGYYDKVVFHNGVTLSLAQLDARMRLSIQHYDLIRSQRDDLATQKAYQQYVWAKFTLDVVASQLRR